MSASDLDVFMKSNSLLTDEVLRLRSQVEKQRRLLKSAYTVLAFAFNRIHALPRTRDTELATDIEKIRAEIEEVIGR